MIVQIFQDFGSQIAFLISALATLLAPVVHRTIQKFFSRKEGLK